MNNLIKNEITKILKKKVFLVILIVVFIFIIISNLLNKYAFIAMSKVSDYNDKYIEYLNEELKNLNPNNPEQLEMYISDQNELELCNLQKQYDYNSWQYTIVQEKAGTYIDNINQIKYKTKDDEELQKAQDEYNKFKEQLNSNDWKKFATEELEALEKSKQELGEGIKDPSLDLQIEVAKMRLDYNIEYGQNFKDEALQRYLSSKNTLLELEKQNNKTYSNEKEYQDAQENAEKSKYAIENDKDIFNQSDARGILLDFISNYELFIIITIVFVAGSIVSEEFNKGTIKLLLVRPYSRIKILLAKFITVLITILFIIAFTIIAQFIVGGIVFGFDSLKIPDVIYNHNTGSLIEISIFKSVILSALGRLPIYILIGSLAFALGTLLNNTGIAITISLLGYMVSSIINELVYQYNLKNFKFFVTTNWDFTQYYYGNLPTLQGLSMGFSCIICLIYFAVMIIPTFIVFKKKNIKNV